MLAGSRRHPSPRDTAVYKFWDTSTGAPTDVTLTVRVALSLATATRNSVCRGGRQSFSGTSIKRLVALAEVTVAVRSPTETAFYTGDAEKPDPATVAVPPSTSTVGSTLVVATDD